MGPRANPATDISEASSCRWLFAEPFARVRIDDALGIAPDSTTRFEVPTRDLCPDASGPGDIDVLICSERTPAEALAMEAKRINLTPASFDTKQPGKLHKLQRAVNQANLLAKIGFHRTFLAVVIATDAREQFPNVFGPTGELARIVDRFPALARLTQTVGLVFFEISQLIDKDVTWSGAFGIRIARNASPLPQPPSLTARLHEFIRA